MVQNILGQGVDIHLLGLREACNDKGVQMTELFTDDSYKISQCFLLSTSQVQGVAEGEADVAGTFAPAQRTNRAPSIIIIIHIIHIIHVIHIIHNIYFIRIIMHTNECTIEVHQFQCSSTSNQLRGSSILDIDRHRKCHKHYCT